MASSSSHMNEIYQSYKTEYNKIVNLVDLTGMEYDAFVLRRNENIDAFTNLYKDNASQVAYLNQLEEECKAVCHFFSESYKSLSGIGLVFNRLDQAFENAKIYDSVKSNYKELITNLRTNFSTLLTMSYHKEMKFSSKYSEIKNVKTTITKTMNELITEKNNISEIYGYRCDLFQNYYRPWIKKKEAAREASSYRISEWWNQYIKYGDWHVGQG